MNTAHATVATLPVCRLTVLYKHRNIHSSMKSCYKGLNKPSSGVQEQINLLHVNSCGESGFSF